MLDCRFSTESFYKLRTGTVRNMPLVLINEGLERICQQRYIYIAISIFGERVTKRDNQNELSYKYSNPVLPQRLIQTKQL